MCLSELLLEAQGLCVYMCLSELLLELLHTWVCVYLRELLLGSLVCVQHTEVHMMYTVIVYEREGIVCMYIGWMSQVG